MNENTVTMTREEFIEKWTDFILHEDVFDKGGGSLILASIGIGISFEKYLFGERNKSEEE